MESFQPLSDRVLIRRKTPEEVTRGGIVVPVVSREAPLEGWVLAVGPGGRASDGSVVPMTVKVGDLVMIQNYVGFPVTIDNEEFLVVAEDEILGIVRQAKTEMFASVPPGKKIVSVT